MNLVLTIRPLFVLARNRGGFWYDEVHQGSNDRRDEYQVGIIVNPPIERVSEAVNVLLFVLHQAPPVYCGYQIG